MSELGTVYPYGLNDRFQSVGNVSKNLKNIINVFSLLNKHKRRKRSHGRRRNKVSRSKITLENLYSIFNKEHGGGLHHLLTTLYSIRLSTLYQLYLECENITGNKDKRFLRIILDVCCRRLFQPVRSNNCVPKPRRHFIKIHFHKGIDKVNLQNMLHNKLVNSKVPIYFKEKEPPVISYKYTDNISRKVFNYNQTLSDVNLSKYGNWNQSCDCKSSTFCYEPHGHIITGDLRIVKNRKLRRLLSKGPKYREENTIDWDLNKNILITAVDDYAKNWSKREGVPVSVLNEWSLTLKLIVSNKINSFKKT